MRLPLMLSISAGLAAAQCYQFSAPGVTYTMNVLSITSNESNSNLTNLIVSQASTLVVNGTNYVAPVGPANLIFIDAGGVSSFQLAFNQVLASPVWGVTVSLTGMLDFLPSGVPAAIPPINSWQLKTPTLGVTIAGGALVKYTITAISSCIPGGGTSPYDLGKELGEAIYQIGCVLCGDPINIATGSLFEQENDYETSGTNRLAFRRYYNSMSASVGTLATSLGKNWRTNFDRYLNLSAGKVIAERPDGRRITFTQNGTTWTTDSDVDITLTNSGSTWTLSDETDTVEAYKTLNSAEALLQTIVERGGYTQTLAYNSANQVISVTDSFNRALTFNYSNEKLVNVATPDNTITFGYDANAGVLTSAGYLTQPATTRKYVYENSSFPAALTGIVDENGDRFLSWTYDSTGRVLTSQNAGGADLTSVAYNDTDGSRTVTNALGLQEIYTFATLQNVPKAIEVHRQGSSTVAAATMKYTYDSNGYMASRTDWNGVTTNYVNNSRGLVTSITDAAGTPQQKVTTAAYHATYRVPTQISMPGLNASFTYDSAGEPLTFTLTDTAANQSRTWTYSWSNFLLQSVKGPRTDLSQTTQLTYDSSGALTSITNALNQVTRVTKHTAGGLPQTIIDLNGVTATVSYDARQRLISFSIATAAGAATTSVNRDSAGNIVSVSLPDGATINNTFDKAHRLTRSSDTSGNTIAYVLDAMGGRTQVTAADQNTTRLKRAGTYDSLGRVLKMTGGANQTTAFTYDPNGNMLTITDPLNRVTTQTFDALNRLTKATDSANGVTTITYDAFNRPLSVTDPNGASTKYIYNGFGESSQQVSPASGTTTYRRDLAGNLIQKTDARDAIANYTYDAANRLVEVTYPGNPAENVTSKYDEPGHGFGIGRLTSITDAAGTLNRSYDERGNVISEIRTHGAASLATTYTYDLASRLKSIQYPSKWIVAYSRDSMGRISGITATSPGGASHQIVSSVSYLPFGSSVSMSYGNGIAESRGVDQDYRVTSISAGGAENLGYSYDAANNVLKISDGINQASSQSFGYDALNRLASASGAYGNLAYAYDANGNRLTDSATGDGLGQVNSLTYNQAGFLATVSSPQQQLTSYTYDAFGSRTVKSGVTTGTTLYQYGPGSRLLEETDSLGNPQVDYIYLGGKPVAAIQANGSIYYVHTDRLGTPLAATDATQSIAWSASYQPFGTESNAATLIAQNLRLPGQEFDLETGIYHNGFRDYAPGLGRYLRSDPMGLAGGINTYAYVANNPLGGVDLWGLCPGLYPGGYDPNAPRDPRPMGEQLGETFQLALVDAVDSIEQPLVAGLHSVNGFDWGSFGLGVIDTMNGVMASKALQTAGKVMTVGEELAAGAFAVGSTLLNTVADFAKAEAGQGAAVVARDLVTGGLTIGTGIVLAPLLASAGLGTVAVTGLTALGTAGVQWLANQSGNLALGITPPKETK